VTSDRPGPRLGGREVDDTGTPCPLCAHDGRRTVGGDTPTLRRLADGSDPRLFCIGTHGYLTDDELSAR
jgi:hypothetical protein